jgi:hypothetical protein
MVTPSIIIDIFNSIIYTAPYDTQLVNDDQELGIEQGCEVVPLQSSNWCILFCTSLNINTLYVTNHIKNGCDYTDRHVFFSAFPLQYLSHYHHNNSTYQTLS